MANVKTIVSRNKRSQKKTRQGSSHNTKICKNKNSPKYRKKYRGQGGRKRK